MAFDKTEYMKQYQKEKLKRVPLNLLPEEYEELKSVCEQSGDTVQGFIKMAILNRLILYYHEGYANNPEAEEIIEKEKQRVAEEGIDIEVPREFGYARLAQKRMCEIVCNQLKGRPYFHNTPDSLYEKIEKNDEARWKSWGLTDLTQFSQYCEAVKIWKMIDADEIDKESKEEDERKKEKQLKKLLRTAKTKSGKDYLRKKYHLPDTWK